MLQFKNHGDKRVHIINKLTNVLIAMFIGLPLTALGRTEGKLHTAITKEDIAFVQHLLQTGTCNPNVEVSPHMLPLFEAISLGNKKIVQLLLEHGADVNAEDKWRGTPLFFATNGILLPKNSDIDSIATMLIDWGANVIPPGWSHPHQTVLHTASREGLEQTVQAILTTGVEVKVLKT